MEDVELLGGEIDRCAVQPDLPALAVDREVAGVDHVVPTVAGTTQDRSDPGHDLGRRERLHHVVVGAELEAEDPIALLDLGRQHDHGNTVQHPDPAQDLQPVRFRQHDVEQQQVESAGLVRLERRGAVGSGVDVVAVAGEIPSHDVADDRLVVDDQDALLTAHGTIVRRLPYGSLSAP